MKYTDDVNIAKLVSAIHFSEKGHGGRCIKDCSTSHVGAAGPMQFMPRTWKAYHCEGMDDRNNLDHSICAGTNYLTGLVNNERKQAKDEADVYFRAAYRYNAGYSKDANRTDGLKQGVNYAERVITEMTLMD